MKYQSCHLVLKAYPKPQDLTDIFSTSQVRIGLKSFYYGRQHINRESYVAVI